MAKENRVNFRVNDEVYKIILDMPGENLSMKFESLIYEYKKKIPGLKHKKDLLEKSISEYEKRMNDLRNKLKKAEKIEMILTRCLRDLEAADA